MPMRKGPGEMRHKESYPPPSVKGGRLGGLEQAGGAEEVIESGLKGGAAEIPSGTDGMIDGRLSQNQAMVDHGSETDGVRPVKGSY